MPFPDGVESTRMSRKLPVAKRLLTEVCTPRIDSGSPTLTVTYLFNVAVSMLESAWKAMLFTIAPVGGASGVAGVVIGGGGGTPAACVLSDESSSSGLRPFMPHAQCPS